jgi:succinate dehydrogenase/fumarate reductase-like Fe-S protein
LVPPRLKAWLLLTLAMLQSLVRRLFGNASGIAAFRRAYDADGLPPVTAAERAELATFSRCLACGVCDRGESERIAASGGAYRGVMPLMLSASRSMPDFRAAAYSLGFVSDQVLAEKERSCPADVPMRRIAAFLRAKAAEVGGPWPLPSRIASLPPPGVAQKS